MDHSQQRWCLPWRKFLPVSFSEQALSKPRVFPAMTSRSWMYLQMPLRRSSHRRRPQTESLHLLLQAHQPRPHPSLGDTGNIHTQRHQLQWRGQDLRSSASLDFFQDFSSHSPKHASHIPSLPTPLHSPTPLVLGPQPTPRDACGDSVPWSS